MHGIVETAWAPSTTLSVSRCSMLSTTRARFPIFHGHRELRSILPLGSLRASSACGHNPQSLRAAHLRCSSAAFSISLQTAQQTEASASSLTNGNTALQATSRPQTSPNGTMTSSVEVSSSDSSSTTLAASVAAQFPAVPPLPPAPKSGNLTDVVPFLIRLALQERHLAWRLAAAMTCMMIAKLAGINLPRVFKTAVDALSASNATEALIPAALAAVFWYGALDCVRAMAKEAQSPVFAPVSQAVTRRVAYHTFFHVLGLDTRFHLDRRTGRVSRILERGTRSIAVLYRALIFTFLPTLFELVAVCWLLARDFGPALAAILGGTFAAYVAWTVMVTQVATEVRKEVNELDNQVSSKAVDGLLNHETVTLFNNQRLEVGRYDALLCDFRTAALRAEYLSALLNAGQGIILAAGMGLILAAIVSTGSASGGDLVMASGLILQLWAPLQFLGWFYRELRAALVDMDDLFQIHRTTTNIPDGETPLPPAPLGPAQLHTLQQQQQQQQQQRQQLRGQKGQEQAHRSALSTAAASAYKERSSSGSSSSSSNRSDNGSVVSGSGSGRGSGNPSSGAGRVRGAGLEGEAAEALGGGGGLAVELVDVEFGYSHDRQILRGVSLSIAPGESVAVVGSSGSGKSTILKLVTRLYDVWGEEDRTARGAAAAAAAATAADTEDDGAVDGQRGTSPTPSSSSGNGTGNGSSSSCRSSRSVSEGGRRSGVYVNGVDVRDLQLQQLRAAISVVPQDTALYFDSVRENIRYGRPDASDAEVEAAARMARLHDTVMAMEKQYDTVVGERGLKLSGGEKQRVAIARAFLRSPRLLICDEATSALDSATEAAIMDSLKELATGRSALFVAHRLSTVRNCDRIVVLQEGVVVEEGSHEQLMAARGKYFAMWELQANQQGGDADDGLTDSDSELADMPPPDAPPVLADAPEAVAAGRGAKAAAEAAEALRARGLVPTDSLDEASEGAAGGGGFSRRAAAVAFAVRPMGPSAVASPAAARVGGSGNGGTGLGPQ